MPSLEAQLLLKAAATATDQGQFSAIAAAYTLDRDQERIQRGAFANTIKAWQDRGRPIPLHWAHKGGPENVIGSVDPQTMAETDEGLYVEGQLDLEGSEMAKEAWRLVKADTVSLSFGFLGEVTPTAKDGTREITNIDLYEVSLTPAPANPDTHFLSIKAVEKPEDKSPEEIQRDLDDMRLEMAAKDLPEHDPKPAPDALTQLSARVDALFAEVRLRGGNPTAEPHPVKQLASELSQQLNEVGGPRFGASNDIFVYVEDYDPDQGWVIYCISGGSPYQRYVRVDFSRTADGVTLADGEVEVERQTQYRPKSIENAEGTDKETSGSRSVDPLRKHADALSLEVASGGVDSHKPPKVKEQPKRQPEFELGELKARSRDQMLELLSGIQGDT